MNIDPDFELLEKLGLEELEVLGLDELDELDTGFKTLVCMYVCT